MQNLCYLTKYLLYLKQILKIKISQINLISCYYSFIILLKQLLLHHTIKYRKIQNLTVKKVNYTNVSCHRLITSIQRFHHHVFALESLVII